MNNEGQPTGADIAIDASGISKELLTTPEPAPPANIDPSRFDDLSGQAVRQISGNQQPDGLGSAGLFTGADFISPFGNVYVPKGQPATKDLNNPS